MSTIKIRPLSTALANEAYQLFQENEDRIKVALTRLKEWLSLQPHLKVRMDDQWLIAFIRGSKYSLERIQTKIESYYTCKTLYADMLRLNRDTKDPVLHHLIHSGSIISYDNRIDSAGPCLLILRAEFDPLKYRLEDVFKFGGMSTDVALYELDDLTISGVLAIIDLEKASFALLRQVTVDLARKCLYTLQYAYPLRIRAVHFINAPIGFKTTLDIIKLFSSEKLKQRYFVHSTLEDLYQHIPKGNIPNEYGGSAGNLEDMKRRWANLIDSHRDWLLEDEQYYIDESLRPENSKKKDGCGIM